MLINGSPHGFFHSSRGHWQGDSLSPYLFVIVMEAFNHMIKWAVEGGFMSACRVGGRAREAVKVSHLLFYR